MDEIEVVKATLNNVLARNARIIQNYEIEIANMTAEIVRLQAQIESLGKKPIKTNS